MAAGWIVTASVIFGADVLIKQTVEEKLSMKEERELPGGRAVIRRVHNKGMFLNLMDQYPVFVTAVSVVLGVILLVYDAILIAGRGRRLTKTGMMFLTGGAFSNIFDRLVRGKVVDYIGLRTGAKKLDQITFNLGDFFIMAGTLLILAGNILRKSNNLQ